MSATAYLSFEDDTPEGRKTRVINVLSLQHGNVLGQIKWFGRWRQYAFFPAPDTVWNPECLDAVNGCIRGLMKARRLAGRPSV